MKSWVEWADMQTRTKVAVDVFDMADVWPSSGYGGAKWKDIAVTLKLYLDRKTSPIMWLDRVWNLQHNGGCALNKIYNVGDLIIVLEAHGKDDYDTLLKHASGRVIRMWERSRKGWLYKYGRTYRHAVTNTVGGTEEGARLLAYETIKREVKEDWVHTAAFRNWATTSGG